MAAIESTIFTCIQWLFFLWVLEQLFKIKLILPGLHYGKIAVEWTLWVLTAGVSAIVGITGHVVRLVRHIPAVVQWLRSVGR